MEPRVLAGALLLCLLVIAVQLVVILLFLARHPRLGRHLRRWTFGNPQQLAKTRHQLYREIALHEATEELLQETQEYLQCVINSIPSVLIGITPEGLVTHWNNAAEQATGLRANEVLGLRVEQCYPELPFNMTTMQQIMATGSSHTRESLQSGQGASASFTDITICPLLSREISGAVILIDDVTLRVRLENMMVQNEKMTSLGELAAGLAHEINNPLAGILNNVQNIMRRTSKELSANKAAADRAGVSLEQIGEYLKARQILEFVDNIKEAGERASQIVKNMLEFSHSNSHLNHVPTDLVALVRHSLELAGNTLDIKTDAGKKRPRIIQDFAAGLPMVECSPSEIQQVILNLLRNAAQAFRQENFDSPSAPCINLSIVQDGHYLRLEISDNGPGMPEDITRHIFEPFFTTKDVGQGTGLGLSVSYFIIAEHHQGTIEVDSQPGKGTRFTIRLPIRARSV